MMRGLFVMIAALCAGPVQALSAGLLKAEGDRSGESRFIKRGFIGVTYERAWRDIWWSLSDDLGVAYRAQRNRHVHKGIRMTGPRWKTCSAVRAIVMRLCAAEAGHRPMFDTGRAIHSMRCAAIPGPGPVFRGICTEQGVGSDVRSLDFGHVRRSRAHPLNPARVPVKRVDSAPLTADTASIGAGFVFEGVS